MNSYIDQLINKSISCSNL